MAQPNGVPSPERPAPRRPPKRINSTRAPAPGVATSPSSSSISALASTAPTPGVASLSTTANPPAPVLRRQDPAIERALSLSNFEGGYSDEDFISALSDKLISTSKSTPGPFDPKPFLETFSPALDQLLALRGQVAERTKKMETDVRRAEREYGKRLRELDGGFEAIGSSFTNLESKIGEVGRTAVRIGEQLESLHSTRSTAQSTSLLISYYLSLVAQTSTTPDPNNPSSTPLEALFATRTSREGRARLAVILRRLMAVAKDVAETTTIALQEAENPAPGTKEAEAGPAGNKALINKRRTEQEKAERVRDEIERYCERFEKEVLRLFDRSYRKGDPRMMAHCAKTLQDFNGGASCVQIYVNQHDFFISKDKVLEDAERENGDGEERAPKIDIWKTIGDPDAKAPTAEPGMEALFKEIRTTVSQEAQIVKAVFPNPTAVMEVFLGRVFAQVIEQHIETLVTRAQAISTLALLRVLNFTHNACTALVEDLKSYDAILAAPGGIGAAASAPGPSKTAPTSGGGSAGPLAAMLDHQLEGIFVPWLQGNLYLETESKNLVELFGGLLTRFTKAHETVTKAKPNSILDKVVNQISSSTSTNTSNNTAQSAAAAISKYANLFTASAAMATAAATSAATTAAKNLNAMPSPAGPVTSPTNGGKPHMPNPLIVPPPSGLYGEDRRKPSRQDSIKTETGSRRESEDRIWQTDGVLDPNMAERMLRWHAEAVGRVIELAPPLDVGKTALALSKVLGEGLGRSYIETALDSALSRIETEPRSEPDLVPLAVLKPADQIFHLWQRYTSTALLPLGGSQAVRRDMGAWQSQNVSRMEGKINAVIQRALDGIVVWMKYLLTKQKKNDYKPSNEDISFARNMTEPCQLCCEFLGSIKEGVGRSLSGKNGEAFLTEVGIAFHSLLLDHYKKFPVNPTGGLMLTKDLASYQEAVGTFGIPAVNDRFEMLRQLGNSFIVQPNVLKSYMTESHLGRIDARLLRPYLAQRSDWSQFSKSLHLDDGGPIPAHEDTAPGHGLFKSNRLQNLQGVAGAGMSKLKNVLKEFEVSPEDLEASRRAELSRQRAIGSGAYYPMPMIRM